MQHSVKRVSRLSRVSSMAFCHTRIEAVIMLSRKMYSIYAYQR